MIQPKDFDEVQAAGGYETLKPGGHMLVIKGVVEGKTQAGREKITVYFDTDKNDVQPNFYDKQYKNDKREPKKWPWNAHKDEGIYTADGDTSSFFKAFTDAVEASNNGFKIIWDKPGANTQNFVNCLKGKLIGGLFRREEYMNDSTGECKFAVKFMSWKTVEEIKNGVEIPKDKLLNPGSNNNSGTPDIYGDLTVIDDGDMPFK